MRSDRFPVFSRWFGAGHRFLASRRLWLGVLVAVAACASLYGVGLFSAHCSTGSCERHVRASLEAQLPAATPTVEWVPADQLDATPLWFAPDDPWRPSPLDRFFLPSVIFRRGHPRVSAEQAVKARAWGYVLVEVAGPFVCQAHFGNGWSHPQHDDSGRPLDAGQESEGVITYLALFGIPVRLNTWSFTVQFAEHPFAA